MTAEWVFTRFIRRMWPFGLGLLVGGIHNNYAAIFVGAVIVGGFIYDSCVFTRRYGGVDPL
jgi:hypothetical protein